MNLGDLVKLYGSNPAPPAASNQPSGNKNGAKSNNNALKPHGGHAKGRGAAPQPQQPQYAYPYGYGMQPYPGYAPYGMYPMPGVPMNTPYWPAQAPQRAASTAAQPSNPAPSSTLSDQPRSEPTTSNTSQEISGTTADAPIAEPIRRKEPDSGVADQQSFTGWSVPKIQPNFVPAPAPLPTGTVLYPGMPAFMPGFRPPKQRRPKPPKAAKDSDDEGDDAGGAALFSCEPCEKDFKQKKFYDAHMKQHLPCPYEGCNFTAVRGVLKMHEIMHMKNMLAKLETPEEVERYRAERRKRYPTLENIRKKQEEEDLKRKERGDLFDPKAQRDQKRGKNNQRGGAATRNNQQRNRNQGAAAQSAPPSNPPAVSTDPAIAAGEAMLAPETNLVPAEAPVEAQHQQSGYQRDRKRPRFPCKFWRQGKCSKGEHCPFSHDEEPQPRKKQKTGENQSKGSGNLMEMFMNEQASQEHDAIMHCLRFIVANKFFQS